MAFASGQCLKATATQRSNGVLCCTHRPSHNYHLHLNGVLHMYRTAYYTYRTAYKDHKVAVPCHDHTVRIMNPGMREPFSSITN